MSAADDFLLAFHRAHPGCTSTAFGRGRVGDAGSSYDLLADCLPADLDAAARVLDLGCGDGHLLELLTRRGLAPSQLVGIDQSAAELSLARARPALDGSTLAEARASHLPLPDDSVAAVLSHLAFMLMSDVEEVVREVRRVLRPGAVFATVIGGGPRVGDTFELFLDLLRPALRDVGEPLPRLGDRRCRSDEGLDELLGVGAGFSGPPRIEDVTVDLGGTAEEVWASLSLVYEVWRLSPEVLADLRAAFVPAARALPPGGDAVRCTMFVRLVVAVL